MVWNPQVTCDGYLAQARVEWLLENEGMEEEEAIQKVMEEFPENFIARQWDPLADCDGFAARSRAGWLMANEGMELEGARLKVMNEFPDNFCPIEEGIEADLEVVDPPLSPRSEALIGGGLVYIRNRAANMVLDCFMSEAADDQGVPVGGWEMNEGENQKWRLVPCSESLADQTFYLVNQADSERVLDQYVQKEGRWFWQSGDPEANSVGTYERKEEDNDNQRWTVEPATAPGYYYIKNLQSGWMLDLHMESSVGCDGSGKQAVTWEANDDSNQMWVFETA